jgi:uncharacterized LabA/DUF88 family protein
MEANEHQEKLKSVVKGRIGVFIDAANLEHSVRGMWVNPKDVPDSLKSFAADQLQWSVDYERFKDFFGKLGKFRIIRFYTPDFQTKNQTGFFHFLRKKLKFKIIAKPLKEYIDHSPETPHRKANFDVELAVDSTFYISDYDTFILFSGDCDFEYLLKFVRGHGKIAIVFSRSGHVAKELPPASSYYFDIIDFRDAFLSKIKVISSNELTLCKNVFPWRFQFATGMRRLESGALWYRTGIITMSVLFMTP